MPEKKRSAEAERMRRKALSRWENEGGAEPCGPQVPGADNVCTDDDDEPRDAGDAS